MEIDQATTCSETPRIIVSKVEDQQTAENSKVTDMKGNTNLSSQQFQNDSNPESDFLPVFDQSDFGCSDFDVKAFQYWSASYDQNYFTTNKLRCTRIGKVYCKRPRQHRAKATSLAGIHQEKRLRKVASSENVQDVNALITHYPDLNLDAADEKKRTALHFSAAKGSDEIVHTLLQNGANPNVRDMSGNSPLHLAACTSHIRVVTLLLHYGGDVNALDRAGKTPLHLALSHLELFRKQEENARCQTDKRKNEVREIACLLMEYLNQKGSQDEREHVSSVLNKIASSTTASEIDEVGELLTNFTKMALDSHNKKS